MSDPYRKIRYTAYFELYIASSYFTNVLILNAHSTYVCTLIYDLENCQN